MDLFNYRDEHTNILPVDGTVNYYGPIMKGDQANAYYDALFKTIIWKNDQAVILGKHFITRRKVAWYGDEGYNYTYSNVSKQALPWTSELLELKQVVEAKTGTKFNSCLLNLYHSGEEGMAWHSDSERSLGTNTTIASVSLGAERKFAFKHKAHKQVISLILEHGSLLVMKDTTQTHWLHRLPPTKKINKPRINLTFRTIVT